MIKHIDMTDEKAKDQEVKEQGGFDAAEGSAAYDSTACDNMAEGDSADADNVADDTADSSAEQREPSPEEVIAVWRDKYMRLQAEFDNYRKRTLREKMDLVEKSEDIAALREGERLVLQKFEEALRQKNVTEIEAQGVEFNPDFHEAVARFAAGEDKKGLIIDVVQRGYMLGDKVLRYAKVVVGE